MFYIVETDSQLERLKDLCKIQGSFIDIVNTNDNFHPALTGLVAVYVRPLYEPEIIDPCTKEVIGTEGKGYIIPIAHDEGINVDKEKIEQLLQEIPVLYIIDKKKGLYHFLLDKKTKDIALYKAMTEYQKLEMVCSNKTYNWYYNRYGDMENLNQIIPLSKLYENCEDRFNQVKELIEHFSEPFGFQFYNETVTKAYFLVEQSGIRVDIHSFEEMFKPRNPVFSISGETVYTSYNLYNVTSRPTNAFNAVNFLAIPKGKKFRECFKPQPGGHFAELDFDGYHIRLVSDLIKYPLNTEEKAHKQIAFLRTGEKEFTKEEYAKAKAENFKMVYGSPSESDAKLEISKKIQDYIALLWKEFNGEIAISVQDKYSGKVFRRSSRVSRGLEDMYPNKLFNYIIQCLETSRNALVLCKVLGYLARSKAKTKVVLITYDSFLLDVAPGEDYIVENVKKIMEGRQDITGETIFPVSVKTSENLIFE